MEAGTTSDLTGIAAVIVAALGCGFLMERLRQPAIVGYILAGVLLGPSAFGLVENRQQIDVLAELGVLLLLFVVGMELSLRVFRRLWRLAVLATAFQVGISAAVMLLLSGLFDWPLSLALLLAFVVALSSTAVAIKVLEDTGELRTRTGRITVGVLVAQDLAVIPMLLTIGVMAEATFEWLTVVKIAVSVGILAWLIWFLGQGPRISLPIVGGEKGKATLTPLAALAFCFGAAAVSGIIGLSAAYGAFIAGLIIGNSNERHAIAENTRPIEAILIAVFFLSIGLLIDLAYIWENLGTVMLLLFLAVVFKTALNVGIFRALGQAWVHAFLAGVMLAQIGEFSFLLSITAVNAGLIDGEASRLVVAVTVLSLAISPLWVVTARRLRTLAAAGITSADGLLRKVYEPEAEKLAETFDGAVTLAGAAAERIAETLREAEDGKGGREGKTPTGAAGAKADNPGHVAAAPAAAKKGGKGSPSRPAKKTKRNTSAKSPRPPKRNSRRPRGKGA